jgi:hypothetical protein
VEDQICHASILINTFSPIFILKFITKPFSPKMQ